MRSMKIRCIQTCSDFNDKLLCIEGKTYNYKKDLSTNRALWILKDNLQTYGIFQSQYFITLAEYREQQINSILDGL